MFCNVSGKEPVIRKSLQLIKSDDCDWVYITGGEPFLHSGIIDICKKIKSFGKKIGVTTNGTVHNYDIIKYVDRIGVSIDGDKTYHDFYRDNSFDKAFSFLKNIIGKVETVLMFTLFEENKHLVNWVSYFGKWLGVDHIQITKGVV